MSMPNRELYPWEKPENAPKIEKPDWSSRPKWWGAGMGGRGKARFKTPDEILDVGWDYIVWCSQNPHLDPRTKTDRNGNVIHYENRRARMPSVGGFSEFVGISVANVYKYKAHKDEELAEAMVFVLDAIKRVQLEGAAAEAFNPTVAARVLKLADVQEVTGPEGKPLPTFNIQPVTAGTFLPNPDSGGEAEDEDDIKQNFAVVVPATVEVMEPQENNDLKEATDQPTHEGDIV